MRHWLILVLISILAGSACADEPLIELLTIETDIEEEPAIDPDGFSEAIVPTAAEFSRGAPPAPKPAPKAPPVFPGAKTLPATGPYKPLYFDNDFSYKAKPDHDYVLGEGLKDVKFDAFDTPFKFSTGGELRHRYMDESNRLRPGGPGDSDYQLWRWRHYVDMSIDDRVRFYIEGIDASSFGEELPEQQIDVNRWDLLNAFVDVTILKDGSQSHVLRYGKQELLFGRQRLVSPLDYANTRRNFEGLRYLMKIPDWKLDAFLTNPLNSATGYRPVAEFDNRFDTPNHDVLFGGVHTTYSGFENTLWDLYWFYLNAPNDPLRPDGQRNTLGTRIARLFPTGDGVWDLDVEGAWQFGQDGPARIDAGMATAVLGHTWKTAPMTPRVSGLFYYGSGDKSVGDNSNNTFSILFPLGHAYWGITDNLSGQNLYDFSLQGDLKPTEKTTLTCAYHWFEMVSGDDRAYNVAGVPVGAPGNGTDLGDALDLYASYAFNPNFDIQIGYFWFWYGRFIDRTTPRGDATQFYLQTSVRY